MKKYVCTICGYIYDEARGIPDAGIAPGTMWDELPLDWVCPLCGATKSEFKEEGAAAPVKKTVEEIEPDHEMRELSAVEMSALCSNLAKGCEKQYKAEEAALFTELSQYFKVGSAPAKDARVEKLIALIEEDLEERFPLANEASSNAQDRGALRALVWSEKVTRILKSILVRYEKEGDVMLENTGVYVCTICGFIFIGNIPPDLCPVCKVPNWKFEKIEGRAS